MADPERGELEFVVNETTYVVVWKTASLIALQRHFSTEDRVADLREIFVKLKARSIEHLVAFIWAGLQKYRPDITYDQTLNLVDDCTEAQMSMLYAAAVMCAGPDPEDEKELATVARRNPRKARVERGTGESGTSRLAASA